MIEYYKKRGETPLQALARLRLEKPELQSETLSYAGRLDPMAEGILPVLVGDEENKNRHQFLNKDKEYEVHFLIGCSSDTGDVLGILNEKNFSSIDNQKIMEALESLTQITNQTYPWFSSKPVDGISLFEHARAGNFDIERPTKEIKIYEVSDINICEVDAKDLIEKNIKDVQSVEGDFRQEKIVEGWENILKVTPNKFKLASCKIKVSSGTYIRGLTEIIANKIGLPCLIQKLIRTHVG